MSFGSIRTVTLMLGYFCAKPGFKRESKWKPELKIQLFPIVYWNIDYLPDFLQQEQQSEQTRWGSIVVVQPRPASAATTATDQALAGWRTVPSPVGHWRKLPRGNYHRNILVRYGQATTTSIIYWFHNTWGPKTKRNDRTHVADLSMYFDSYWSPVLLNLRRS